MTACLVGPSSGVLLTCPACNGSGQVPESLPRPRTVERDRNLGWMALSPSGYRYRIGVEGDTEREAIVNWYESARRWEELGRLAAERKGGEDRP